MADRALEGSIAIERAIEQLRQERDTFNQRKKHAMLWFILKLTMGYTSIIILALIGFSAFWIVYHHYWFSNSVIVLAATALFVDAIGLVAAVWKIVLNPNFQSPLAPTTNQDLSSIESDDNQER